MSRHPERAEKDSMTKPKGLFAIEKKKGKVVFSPRYQDKFPGVALRIMPIPHYEN